MSTILNVKIDPKVKAKANKIAGELGMTLSGVVNVYLRELIRTKTLHVSAREENPSRSLAAAIKSAKRDHLEGKTIKFSSGKDAVEFLNTLKKKK